MGAHGHGEPYKIPNHCIYKVENIPKLLEVQQALARQGLRDPWLRNEVWRYQPELFGTHLGRARQFFLRGFPYGFGAFIITIAAEYALGKGDHEHGHCDDDHGAHHK